ncbi:MAG: hypothetical protein IJ799_04755, partial [Bacteroidales bacterium]|nr:hypothetical protein [Bacteroidales bacterium]
TLSLLELKLEDVSGRFIVDLLTEKRDRVLRSYETESAGSLLFPYLKPGRYCIRVTEDANRNGIVDTGSVLEHRQPEKVRFLRIEDEKYIDIPASTELVQTIKLSELFKD